MLEDLGLVLSGLGSSLDASFHRDTFIEAAETFLALALGYKSGLRGVDLHFASPNDLATMVLAQEARGLRPACRRVPYLSKVVATEPTLGSQVVGLYVPPRGCYAIDRLVPGLSCSLPRVQNVTLVHEAGHALIARERMRLDMGSLRDEEQAEADRLCDDLADLFDRYTFGQVEHQPSNAVTRAGMQARFRELTRPITSDRSLTPRGYGRPCRWVADQARAERYAATQSHI